MAAFNLSGVLVGIESCFLLTCLMFVCAGTAASQTPDTMRREVSATMRVDAKDGMTYVWIAPGSFRMGCSPGDDECFDEEEPTHPVTITKGFWIGQTLVMQAAYRRVKGDNPRPLSGEQVAGGQRDLGQRQCLLRSRGDASADGGRMGVRGPSGQHGIALWRPRHNCLVR